MRRKRYIVAGLCVAALISSNVWAADDENKPKRTLKEDGSEVYNVLPQAVDCFKDAFVKGMFYGRVRTNYFNWDWEEDNVDPTPNVKQKDHQTFGVGGSLIYKSAPFYGVSGTAGLYTSQNPFDFWNVDKSEVKYAKAGREVFSRGEVSNAGRYDGDWGITTLAQAYLEYADYGFDVKGGRQIYESFFTRSNDTKMIPNTFEGLSVGNKSLPGTTLSAAYFDKQKLRDHEDFHDVIAVDDDNVILKSGVYTANSNASTWRENDDSGAHLGLTKSRLAAKDIDTALIVAGVANESVKDLKLEASAAVVPDLFWTGMLEANYKISFGGGWSLTPGVRYVQQFDEGAGEIGGAAISGKLVGGTSAVVPVIPTGASKGYSDADSADGSLWAARLVLAKGAGSLSAGYSKVADDADLIAPWRGFPTGGYTRDIGQVNWEADVASWMIKYTYDFDKAKLLKGFKAALDYCSMNYDEEKERLDGLKKTDANIIHLDMWQAIPWLPGLQANARIARYSADNYQYTKRAGIDPSYFEWRFGLDYLF